MYSKTLWKVSQRVVNIKLKGLHTEFFILEAFSHQFSNLNSMDSMNTSKAKVQNLSHLFCIKQVFNLEERYFSTLKRRSRKLKWSPKEGNTITLNHKLQTVPATTNQDQLPQARWERSLDWKSISDKWMSSTPSSKHGWRWPSCIVGTDTLLLFCRLTHSCLSAGHCAKCLKPELNERKKNANGCNIQVVENIMYFQTRQNFTGYL